MSGSVATRAPARRVVQTGGMSIGREGEREGEREARGLPGRHEGAPRLSWHAAPPEEVAAYWQSDLERGLGEAEATERLHQVGENALTEAPAPPLWRRFVAQVSDF